MNTLKLIALLVSAVLCAAEPQVNTYLPAARSSSTRNGPVYSNQQRISNQYGVSTFGGRQSGFIGSQSGLGSGISNRYSASAFTPQRSFPSFLPSSQQSGSTRGYNGAGAANNGPYSSAGYSRGGYAQENDQSDPANYQFSYEVSEPEYGVEFGHEENRQGDNARGTYYVLLPDGRRQRVDYTADLGGYKPMISYEETEVGGRGGYYGGATSSQIGGAGGYSGRQQAGGASRGSY